MLSVLGLVCTLSLATAASAGVAPAPATVMLSV